MKLHYFPSRRGNFGDDLNLWLWDRVLPGWRESAPDRTLFGVGTILSNTELRGHPGAVVMGSGTGYGHAPEPEVVAACEFRAVRGPMTAAKLGLDPSIPQLDGAMVIPALFPEIAGLEPAGGRAVFIPHHTTAALSLRWEDLCDGAGVDYLSPEGEAKSVIARIANSSLVLTESMHGAILADAYRVPWVPLMVSDQFNLFKWRDWAGGLEMTVAPMDMLREMRSLRGIVQRLRALKPAPRPASKPAAAGTGLPAGPGGQAPGPGYGQGSSGSEREKLKRLAERLSPVLELTLRHRLRQARRHKPQLSADSRLSLQHARFLAAAEALHEDLARPAP